MATGDSASKVCTKCGNEKPISEFSKKSLFRLSSHCKDCSRAYIRDHYRRNKDYYIKKARKRSEIVGEENRKKLIEYLLHHPCVDCGESDPRVLEFDHTTGEKLLTIALMVKDYPWHRVEAEIAKCQVRCANCHRRRTHESLGWWGIFNPKKPS